MTYIYTSPPTAINDSLKIKNKLFDFTVSNESYADPQIVGTSKDYSIQYDFYQNIGIDIVAETVFDYPCPYISEKVFRPISCKRPFIVVGAAYTLKLLQTLGFKTFPNIINESYDNIQDPEQRLIAVVEEINNFVNRPISSIINDVKESELILNYNFEHLLKFEDLELEKIKNILN
jgi:hypothetical protein